MKVGDYIHSEVISIERKKLILEEKETGKTVISLGRDMYGPLKVGDIIVHQVVEVSDDQVSYGVDYVETIKMS